MHGLKGFMKRRYWRIKKEKRHCFVSIRMEFMGMGSCLMLTIQVIRMRNCPGRLLLGVILRLIFL